jgi:hypothetical protein
MNLFKQGDLIYKRSCISPVHLEGGWPCSVGEVLGYHWNPHFNHYEFVYMIKKWNRKAGVAVEDIYPDNFPQPFHLLTRFEKWHQGIRNFFRINLVMDRDYKLMIKYIGRIRKTAPARLIKWLEKHGTKTLHH